MAANSVLQWIVVSVALGLLGGCGENRARRVTGGPAELEPAFSPGNGPLVLYDVGHNNVDDPEVVTAVAERLGQDGYVVREVSVPFTQAGLANAQILIIKNALAAENREHWALPTPSALTQQEIEELEGWVRAGGALVLVIDHMPIPGAMEELVSRFRIEVSNGFAVKAESFDRYDHETVLAAGALEFRRTDGSLTDHPITNGRTRAERVDSVGTGSGSAFRLPGGGQSLLTLGSSIVSLLPEVSWEFDDETPRMAVGGWSQAGVLRVGAGRVAVLGDAMLLTAPELIETPAEAERAAQNPQFTMNLFYWLSDLLPDACS